MVFLGRGEGIFEKSVGSEIWRRILWPADSRILVMVVTSFLRPWTSFWLPKKMILLIGEEGFVIFDMFVVV